MGNEGLRDEQMSGALVGFLLLLIPHYPQLIAHP
jgi:hypothetical protein